MTRNDIEVMLEAIIERAEYAGRQHMLAIKTTGNRIAKEAHENADISSRVARQTANRLVDTIMKEGLA